ncbi:hypothetical protein [Mesorhizobium sp. 113-1-2]|uniref:hypothetical protein n=1 Tax=Mesorhizobium sp. 113-1-2 TaxID=2744515 RepID=UPI0019289EDE|nr:hypothetical protein [Mesorhizobium sp. 113-1-2]
MAIMTSDGSILWAIAATIALFGADLSAAQAGANRLGLCRLRAQRVRARATTDEMQPTMHRQAHRGAGSRLSTAKEQQDGAASPP